MFFFKKKKLIEIDNKIDSVLEQLTICNQKYDEMLNALSKIENRIDSLGVKMEHSQGTISENVKQTELSIIEKLVNLQEFIKTHDDAIRTLLAENIAEILSKIQLIVDDTKSVKDDISKSQKETIVTVNETIHQVEEQLQYIVAEDGKISRNKTEKVAQELDKKLDMTDSLLRLLLLNSVMDQIKE